MSGGTVFVSSALIATKTGRHRGVPPTQGHRFTDPRTGRTIEQKDARIKLWRQLIALQIRMSQWVPIMSGPITCTLDFQLPRPKSHYVADDPSRPLREDAPIWHTSKPDADTLARAVLDGLSKKPIGCGAIGDDAQIALLVVSKRYSSTGQVGVRIVCESMAAPLEVAS